VSHELCCILNASDGPATVELNGYFEDREPAGPFSVEVGSRRTLHLRFNLTDPRSAPRSVHASYPLRCARRLPTVTSGFARPHVARLGAIAFPISS
jgi:hypothetical protein